MKAQWTLLEVKTPASAVLATQVHSADANSHVLFVKNHFLINYLLSLRDVIFEINLEKAMNTDFFQNASVVAANIADRTKKICNIENLMQDE